MRLRETAGSSSRTRHPAIALAVLCAIFLLAAACHAEDVPKTEAAEKSPAPPAAPTGTAFVAPAFDALAIEGAPPQFPLQIESYAEIDDKVDVIKDYQLEFVDAVPLIDTLVALRASTQEHLQQNIDRAIDYRKLMLEAEACRGHVVEARGVFQFEVKVKVPKNKSGVTFLYEGYIRNGKGEVYTYHALAPVGIDNAELHNKPVRLTGIFLKRYSYLSKKTGDGIYWTPLLLIRKVELLPEDATAGRLSWSAINIILTILISAGLFVLFYTRLKERSPRGNYFTLLKRARGEKPTIFPRPKPYRTAPPPRKKPAPDRPPPSAKSP